jgi:hypothetical protein
MHDRPAGAKKAGERLMDVETTDLERRVLAHERILQGLIAQMVEAEPKFLERLKTTFSNPVRLEPERVDYTDTAAYAVRFVREVIRLGESSVEPTPSKVAQWDDLWPTVGEPGLVNENVPVRFEIRKRDDLWEVLRNGRLAGGYVSHAGALDAVQSAIQTVFTGGGAAELITPAGPEGA